MDHVITPEEFEKKMKNLWHTFWDDYGDEERVHQSMDYIMLETLRSLGYGAGCDVFEDTPKWYA